MPKFIVEVEYDEDEKMSDDDVKDLVYEALRDYGFQSVAVWEDKQDT